MNVKRYILIARGEFAHHEFIYRDWATLVRVEKRYHERGFRTSVIRKEYE